MLVGFAELRWGGNGRTDRFRHATAAAPVIATRWLGLRERQTLLIAAMLTVVLAALVLPPFVFLLNASMVAAQNAAASGASSISLRYWGAGVSSRAAQTRSCSRPAARRWRLLSDGSARGSWSAPILPSSCSPISPR